MHRSGTSLLTGTLETLGVHLGEVRVESPYNLKGNRESIAIQAFHDRLLAKNDASWRAPPAGQCQWDTEDIAAARELLNALVRPDQPWGFKDPRAIFALDGWTSLLDRPRMVAIVRPRSQVARSLSLRGAVSIAEQEGAVLWRRYNRELLRLVKRHRIPVLPFPGLAPQREQFFQNLDVLCKSWGLKDMARADFYDPQLIHHCKTGAPKEAEGLYAALLAAGAQVSAPITKQQARTP